MLECCEYWERIFWIMLRHVWRLGHWHGRLSQGRCHLNRWGHASQGGRSIVRYKKIKGRVIKYYYEMFILTILKAYFSILKIWFLGYIFYWHFCKWFWILKMVINNTGLRAWLTEASRQTHTRCWNQGRVSALLSLAALGPLTLQKIRSWHFRWYRILFNW